MNHFTFQFSKSLAYRIGYTSYSEHFFAENPYIPDTEEFDLWEEGWLDARYEDIDT